MVARLSQTKCQGVGVAIEYLHSSQLVLGKYFAHVAKR
jgi:hypothetical protein